MADSDRKGLPGIPILLIMTGAALVFAGLKNASVADVIRSMIEGKTPESRPSDLPPESASDPGTPGTDSGGITPIAGGGGAQTVVDTARAALGTPYRWGGHAPGGFDCSGLVSYCLTKAGVDIPYKPHTVAAAFYVWNGATTIPRAQCAPGDLVCWSSHIGIAISNTQMIHAPTALQVVKVANIWSVPAPAIRRPKAYGVAPNYDVWR